MRVLSKFKTPKATRMLGGALGLLLVLSLVLMPAAPVLAVPPQPHQFEGTVTIGTQLAPKGTIVSAKINVTEYESGTVDAEGRYGSDPSDLFMVPADDPGTPDIKEGGEAGDTVDFYISNEAMGLDSVKANETAEFEIWGINELNLTVPPTQYTLDVATVGNGSVTKVPDQVTYTYGDVVQLTAVPDTGSSFDGWSGDLTGTTNPDSITMDAAKTVTATFTQITFTLTMAVTGNGTTDPTVGDHSYAEGTVVNISATPDAGWEFANWTGDVGTVAAVDAASTTITMNDNYSITANFAIDTFTITVTQGDNGTITPGTTVVDYGEDLTFTITADEGYSIADVLVDGESVMYLYPQVGGFLPVQLFYTFEDVAAIHTISANFELIPPPTYALTMAVEPVGGGTATDVTGLSPYEAGAVVNIKAVAEALYQFVDWTAPAGTFLDATQEETTFTMPGEAVTVTATFTLQTFTITATAGEGGSILPSGAVVVDYGAEQLFTITPNEGYEIADVLIDGASIPAVPLPHLVLFKNVTYDRTIHATFAVTITHTLTMEVVGEGTVTPVSGDYAEGDMAITATIPVSGWEFAGWSTTDMAEIADPTSAQTTLTLDKDKTVTATFTEVVTYDLTVASTDGGSVTSPVEGTSTHNAGTVVNLVAVPEEDYTFGWWSGDVVADVNAASTTITMDSAKSIVANFVEFSAPENVSVTEIDPGVESVTVTIEPVEELDVTEMPAGMDAQEAYVVEPTGTGSFTLIFTVPNASDIRVYKVVDGTWTLLEVTVVDATTIKVTMEVADPILVFALPPPIISTTTLSAGWNLLSTPIKLDADSDSLEQILGESVANIEACYRWDAPSQQWEIPTGYELSPLEAVYVRVKSDASATAEFIPSGQVSGLPSRELQRGLNLIGPAPALEEGVFPETPLGLALISIEEAEGGLRGYTIVVSPAHNQTAWSYALGSAVKDLVPFKGYWVVMENADTLFGFSTTPAP